MAAVAGADAGRQEADACPTPDRATARRRDRCGDDDRAPRGLERQGQAGAVVAPGPPKLARGICNLTPTQAGPVAALPRRTRWRTGGRCGTRTCDLLGVSEAL